MSAAAGSLIRLKGNYCFLLREPQVRGLERGKGQAHIRLEPQSEPCLGGSRTRRMTVAEPG